jgi:hypothetical protein
MSLSVNFFGKQRLPNKFKDKICEYILEKVCGHNAKEYYLHFEIMDYDRGVFTGFVATGKIFYHRVKRFRVKVIQWLDSGRPFSGKDEFYKLLPGEKYKG